MFVSKMGSNIHTYLLSLGNSDAHFEYSVRMKVMHAMYHNGEPLSPNFEFVTE